VGYIDSAIIKLNNLELLDITGLKFDSSSRVVIEYLKKKGVNVIE
jgi:beta-lactamase superfamily II metal-dependent hydrolase